MARPAQSLTTNSTPHTEGLHQTLRSCRSKLFLLFLVQREALVVHEQAEGACLCHASNERGPHIGDKKMQVTWPVLHSCFNHIKSSKILQNLQVYFMMYVCSILSMLTLTYVVVVNLFVSKVYLSSSSLF